MNRLMLGRTVTAWITPLALGTVLLSGCVTSRSLDRADTTDRAALNARAQRQPATVVLRSGERVRADALRLDADGATWMDRDGTMHTAAYDDVAAVRFSDGLPGSARGAAIGALAMGAVGLLGAATAEPSFLPRWPFVVGGMLGGAVVGSLFGYDGVRTVYRGPVEGTMPDDAP